MKKIILASTSVYRKTLMEKIGLAFTVMKSPLDEDLEKNKLIGKPPQTVADHLSKAKGADLLKTNRDLSSCLIISGDQLVNFKGQILGKAGSTEKAIQQLEMMSGHSHDLVTATTITCGLEVIHNTHITTLKMKNLSPSEIKSYVEKDHPIDCAGSYKIESLGLCLFEKIECSDFSAIQGLPLIWLSNTLKEMGYELFKD